MTQFIDDIDQLYALPVRTVVHSRSTDLIAARFDTLTGRVFGDERPIAWRDVDLPAAVLFRPDGPTTQWDPPPPPELDTFEMLLDLPPGSVIKTKFRHADGHRVYEKFPDFRWRATGSGRHIPVDRLETMLPARLLDHPRWSNA